jgi:hypothetical protein
MISKELPLSLLRGLLGFAAMAIENPPISAGFQAKRQFYPRSMLAEQLVAGLFDYPSFSHPTCSLNAFYSFTHYRGRRLACHE